VALPGLLEAQTATTITATPAVLAFQYQIGTTKLPAAQPVALKASATGLTVTLAITGDLPSNGAWLTTSVPPGASFGLPGAINVTVTPTGLAAGSYGAIITISGSTSTGVVQQTVAVTLEVSPPASSLHVSPATLPAFSYTTGGTVPAQQQFLLYSDGSPMSVTITVPSSATWLEVNPTGLLPTGGLNQVIKVNINQAALANLQPGAYTASVTISAPTALNKTTSYAVTLNVNAAPPVIAGTWPAGVVSQTGANASSTTVVVNGSNFFSTSTVAVTGFTNSTVVTVTDSSGVPLTASQTISIPVYSATATNLRLTMGSPLPTGFNGAVYQQDLSSYVAGGTAPYTWTSSGLPTGLVLSAAGMLSGTPTVAGNYAVVVTVTDTNGLTAYVPVSMTVYPTGAPPVNTSWLTVGSVIPAGTVGTAYTTNLNVLGGNPPYTWLSAATSSLPAGLVLATTGNPAVVSGTPTSVGMTSPLAAKLLSAGALQVTIPATYIATLGVLRMAVTTPKPGGGTSTEAQLGVYGPEPRILSVVNSASYAAGTVAPGELITIFGTGLWPPTLAVYDPNSATLPTTLPTPPAGVTQVQFNINGTLTPAALIYTEAGQIGAMVPYEVSAAASVQMIVSYGSLTSTSYPISVAALVPGIFSADGSGKGQGAILNYNATTNDYVINSSANAAVKGSLVIMYVTGFGATSPASTSYGWSAAGVDTATPATVTIGDGQFASVVSGVPAGSFPGVLQLNVTVPATAPSGKAVPVTVSFNGVSAQTGITMAVK
jgi:uncharacterized protein (TIGR03437 family)